MKNNQWRNLLEIIGVLSIVAGLLMVAMEIRQANRIATAQTVMQLAAQFNEFNAARFENPALADLTAKIQRPDDISMSSTERSMASGLAWHFGNIFWSAEIAHQNGLLSDDDLLKYRSDLEWMITYMPGLNPEFLIMFDTMPAVEESVIFEPLKVLADGN